MGTLVTITLYADTPEQAQSGFLAAFRRIEKLNDIFSDYKPDSELSHLCDVGVAVSPELMRVLQYAQQLAAETDGAFDITVGPLTRLWRASRKDKRLPSPEKLAAALARSGYRNLQLDPLQCMVPGMQLDAGAIAKGYAGDEAITALRAVGIRSALVAMSGDVVTGDAPPGRKGWRVRAQNEELTLVNAAVSTSGDEYQFAEIDGIRYSHILHPRTGKALQNSPSVSVVAKTGMEADALATAASVLGIERAKALRAFRPVRVFSAAE